MTCVRVADFTLNLCTLIPQVRVPGLILPGVPGPNMA